MQFRCNPVLGVAIETTIDPGVDQSNGGGARGPVGQVRDAVLMGVEHVTEFQYIAAQFRRRHPEQRPRSKRVHRQLDASLDVTVRVAAVRLRQEHRLGVQTTDRDREPSGPVATRCRHIDPKVAGQREDHRQVGTRQAAVHTRYRWRAVAHH